MNLKFVTVFLFALMGLQMAKAQKLDSDVISQIEISDEEAEQLSECFDKKGISADRLGSEEYSKAHEKDIIACFAKLPSFRPVIALMNLGNYLESKLHNGVITFCGRKFNITQIQEEREKEQTSDENIDDEEDTEESTDVTDEDQISEEKMDFCTATTKDVLPAFCRLAKKCEKKDIELAFVLYYVGEQLIRHHPAPYTCKGLPKGLVNAALYKPNFNFKAPLLTKPLPCKSLPKSPTTEDDDDLDNAIPSRLTISKPLIQHFIAKLR